MTEELAQLTQLTVPKLAIVCSSPEGKRRLDRAAEVMLSQMPAEMAQDLAASVVVFALDHARHAGFAQGMHSHHDGTGEMIRERQRQGRDSIRELTIIVLVLEDRIDAGWLLGHELGHAALKHTQLSRGQAASLTAAELVEMEQEADAFAAKYRAW
jgi:hypothetical protein